MIARSITRLPLLLLLAIPALAQSPASTPAPPATPAPTFEAADVHSSPHANFPFSQPGMLHGDRYVMRQATMVDLISNAWGIDASNVQGGPPWLELDRFDISAKAPRATAPADLKLMLQSLLKDRFSLVVHNGTAPMPAYILTADNPKLKPSEGSAAAGCEPGPPPSNQPPGAISTITVNCHNTTSDQLAQDLQQMAGGYIDKPIINNTGLQGSFDFQIVWTPRGRLAQAGSDGISIFDAVRKLGLKLQLQTAPRPVLLVDSVNETPTPNAPDIAKLLPPPPPAQFDVAVIKPAGPADSFTGGIRGDQINLTNIPLKFLISFAWDLNPNDNQVLAGAPPWLDKDHFDILAKVAPDETTGTAPQNGPPMDLEQLRLMLRALLIERFQMKVHTEDRPIDAYTVAPRLTPADPATRTKCTEGPGPDGKDPRIANPVLGRLLYCRNMTLAEFGQQLPFLASGYIYAPVLDNTGLKGAWDFTLSFSPAGQVVPGAAPAASSAPPSSAAEAASDPNGAVTLFDAVHKQLGLKLEKQKRSLPVLVIDQINEKPTED